MGSQLVHAERPRGSGRRSGCNGHRRLARQPSAEGIDFTAADNACVRVADWPRAQELADGFSPDQLHRALCRYAALRCPFLDVFKQTCPWNPIQSVRHESNRQSGHLMVSTLFLDT